MVLIFYALHRMSTHFLFDRPTCFRFFSGLPYAAVAFRAEAVSFAPRYVAYVRTVAFCISDISMFRSGFAACVFLCSFERVVFMAACEHCSIDILAVDILAECRLNFVRFPVDKDYRCLLFVTSRYFMEFLMFFLECYGGRSTMFVLFY